MKFTETRKPGIEFKIVFPVKTEFTYSDKLLMKLVSDKIMFALLESRANGIE